MNKRDSSARFKVTEVSLKGERETYFACGLQIEDRARLRQVLKSNQPHTLRSNASLRTCMKVIANFSDLDFISVRRCFKHCGVHEKCAKPIIEYGKRATP